ncbi:nuclear transport factor 2 [Rhodotorula diobovata]|uniref:Nuclear transport factor 2 n=1 Tax=Rhodotorula diobovata TaxID=5288 RepID=A0A5C5FZE0_9BASI|nr:nuclear transport factor 2 [Rhodotorula diobovata]
MADINAIAKQFTDFYYQTFDADRKNLAPLYRDHSMLSFEAQQFQGTNSIIEKLASLPFTTIQHRISTMDAQPAATDKASMIVLVTGQLLTGDEQNALSFSQAFHLIPEGGSYYIFNDVFRLVYG